MTNTHRRSSRATTAPKGRRTPNRDEPVVPPPRDTVTLQWIGVGVLVAGLLAVAFYFARDQQPQNIHGGGGRPAGVVVGLADETPTV